MGVLQGQRQVEEEKEKALLILKQNREKEVHNWDARHWSVGAQNRFMMGIERFNSFKTEWPRSTEFYAR